MTNERQEQRVSEAAETFAEALIGAYRVVAGRSVSAQELNAQLTQEFFNGVINNLKTHAESNRDLAGDLIELQRKQQEASRALAQESVNAYMDFLRSVFTLPQPGARTTGRTAGEAGSERSTEPDGGEGATKDDTLSHPLGSWVRTSSDTPITPPEKLAAPGVPIPPGSEERPPREAPPPGEERPERRGSVPTTPTAREEPPPGEEKAGRRRS